MTIKYEFSGTEALQRQIELLKFYPEIFDKHFYPAMERAAEEGKKHLRSNIPSRRVLNALGSKVIHSGTAALGTRADIGFGRRYGMPSARFAAPLNEGAVPHEVAARRSADGMLHSSAAGNFYSFRSMQHPGFSGRHFMEQSLEEATPTINALIEQASGKVVQELAKP